jgi:ketosteroid isomerase-like protein
MPDSWPGESRSLAARGPRARALRPEAQLSDPIAPPAARWPSEAAELVALAVSDGDLGAAVAQYEPAAALLPWSSDGSGSQDGRPVAETVAAIMRLRLPLDVRLVAVLPAAGLTMLVCERRIAGQGPDGQPVSLQGVGCTVVRPQDDGSWRIAADAWCLAHHSPQ